MPNRPSSYRRACNGLLLIIVAIVGAAAAAASTPSRLVAIGLDSDARLVDGEAVPPPVHKPDIVSFLYFRNGRPVMRGQIAVPVSFQGVPTSIAVSSDQRLAFVTAATGPNAEKPGTYVPLDILSVIDLSSGHPALVQTIHLGFAPSGVAISPDDKSLVVTHGDDDSVSVLRIVGNKVTLVGCTRFAKGSKPLGAAFESDGRAVLVTFAGSNRVGVFSFDGRPLSDRAINEISAGIYPASLAVCGKTGLAVIANYGSVSGDADTVSLVDLKLNPARVIDTVTVGPSPEGVDCSDDGHFVAAALQNMTTLARLDPRYRPAGKLVLLTISNRRLAVTDSADIGGLGAERCLCR